MKILFFGATELGYFCCQQLFDMGEQVVGILTIPQEFRISYSPTVVRNVTFRDFEELGIKYGVPVIKVTTKMTDEPCLDAIITMGADLGLAIGWYYIIPQKVRELFPRGVIGIHASLLPKYRGGAPLVWAIINGERATGVTLFYLDGGVDTGDIIGQDKFTLEAQDTIKIAYNKAKLSSFKLLQKYIPQLKNAVAPRMEQDHNSATYFPQRTPEDGLIRWQHQTAKEVYDWIRAQTRPYPGAYSYLRKEKITIWRAHLPEPEEQTGMPGTVIVGNRDGLTSFGVLCSDSRVVFVDEVGLGNGATLSGAEFVRTRGVFEGEVFS